MRFQLEDCRMKFSISHQKKNVFPQRMLEHTPTTRSITSMTRNFEVEVLRADQKMQIAQFKAPAMPIFKSAFSAFARKSLISTTQGCVAIENLSPGDN